MDKVSVLDVVDRDSEQNAQVIIRSVKGYVALTLTLEHEGDVQVVLSPAECVEVVARLQQAVTEALTESSSASEGYSYQEVVEIDPAANVLVGATHR